jgi:hypothetical protein
LFPDDDEGEDEDLIFMDEGNTEYKFLCPVARIMMTVPMKWYVYSVSSVLLDSL